MAQKKRVSVESRVKAIFKNGFQIHSYMDLADLLEQEAVAKEYSEILMNEKTDFIDLNVRIISNFIFNIFNEERFNRSSKSSSAVTGNGRIKNDALWIAERLFGENPGDVLNRLLSEIRLGNVNEIEDVQDWLAAHVRLQSLPITTLNNLFDRILDDRKFACRSLSSAGEATNKAEVSAAEVIDLLNGLGHKGITWICFCSDDFSKTAKNTWGKEDLDFILIQDQRIFKHASEYKPNRKKFDNRSIGRHVIYELIAFATHQAKLSGEYCQTNYRTSTSSEAFKAANNIVANISRSAFRLGDLGLPYADGNTGKRGKKRTTTNFGDGSEKTLQTKVKYQVRTNLVLLSQIS